MHDAIAVIPARNEESSIRAVVEKTTCHCAVIVVNDHSNDGTVAVASRAGAKVIDLSGTTGYGAALMAGFRDAISMGCRTIVSLDADGAHDPDDIPAMLHVHLTGNAPLTLGNRFSSENVRLIPSAKRWANHFATVVTNRILGTRLHDVACGLRVLSPDFAAQLDRSDPWEGFEFVMQLLQLAQRIGKGISSCPVQVHYDGTELHATSQRELLDAVIGVQSLVPKGAEPALTFDRLHSCIARMTPVTLRIENTLLCMHPLDRSYVFQLHPAILAVPQFGTFIDFDVAMPTVLHRSTD